MPKRSGVRKFKLPLVGEPQALPVTLQTCERLSARLTTSACADRYDKGNTSGYFPAIAAQFVSCRDCPIGRRNSRLMGRPKAERQVAAEAVAENPQSLQTLQSL